MLPEPTFRENEAALADDDFPLWSYPSQDADGRPVDPFHPVPGQYPSDTGFDEVELAHGGNRRSTGSGVTGSSRLQTVLPTQRQLRHGRGNHLGPINRAVPGDGIQPAWGMQRAALPADQCITVV